MMPVEAQREKCPTCGSLFKDFKDHKYFGSPTNITICDDPWHSPAVPESAPPKIDRKREERLDRAWEDLGHTLREMSKEEPGW